MFHVVACPGCTRPRVVEDRFATTVCPFCGTPVETQLHSRLQAPTAEAARAALVRATTPVDAPALGAPPAAADAHADAVAAARAVNSQSQRAEAAAETLGVFTEAAFVRVLDEVGVPAAAARELLRVLVARNLVYEPRPGTYAWLG